MSKCIECGAAMDMGEAQKWFECRSCRRRLKGGERVRDLNRMGTDQVGRPAMPPDQSAGDVEDYVTPPSHTYAMSPEQQQKAFQIALEGMLDADDPVE